MNDLILDFGSDIVENCVLGAVTNNSIRDSRRKFRKILKYLLKFHFRGVVVNILRILSPFVVELFHLVEIPPKLEFFFYDVLHNIEKFRNNNKIYQRSTLMKFLLDIKDQEIIDLKKKGKKGMIHTIVFFVNIDIL